MAAPKLLPAYLIVGVDKLKQQTAVKRLKARLDPGMSAFNLDERTASSDLDPTSVAISLNTLPIGDSFRLVIINDAGRLAKPVSETIISYLANPNPGCVLCLVAEKLAKNTRLYKALAKVGKHSVIDCSEIKARDLPAYVNKHAGALGISLDSRAVNELISRVGSDTTMIDRQLLNLRELCGGRIGVQDVEQNVARTAEVKPWEFLNKVVEGDATRALELYRHMQDPKPLGLLTLLTRQVRDLVCARALIDRGRASDVPRELGKQEWQVRKTVQAARRRSVANLRECLQACAQCERDLKSGADEETTFVRLVVELCTIG